MMSDQVDVFLMVAHDIVWGQVEQRQLSSLGDHWLQGFEFHKEDKLALVQYFGGPCSVLAPVQAFIVKNAMFTMEPFSATDFLKNQHEITEAAANDILVKSLSDILNQLSTEPSHWLTLERVCCFEKDCGKNFCPCKSCPLRCTLPKFELPDASQPAPVDASSEAANLRHCSCSSGPSVGKFERLLRFVPVRSDATTHMESILPLLQGRYGVLLFLYNLICKKGVDNVRVEMSSAEEPLISSHFQHGTQALTNLLITGSAVPNLFDYDKDVCGVVLPGIRKQPDVGFLSLLERLRYLEVGSFLKSPRYPIWVLAGERHLTVFFSDNLNMARGNTVLEEAQRAFKALDPEENGFIISDVVPCLMEQLQLISEPWYVAEIASKLDPEGAGIILMSRFLDEFFSEQIVGSLLEDSALTEARVYHYNGLAHFGAEASKRLITTGVARFLPSPDLRGFHLDECLRTKWPNLATQWIDGRPLLD